MALTSLEMAQLAAEAAISRRARDVLILDLRELASFTDFFIIGSGTSDTQLQGIQDAIVERLKDEGATPWKREGSRQANWLVLDYVEIVVHLFLQDARSYYNLERLWGDAPQLPLPDVPESMIMDAEFDAELDDDWDDLDEYELDDFDSEEE